MAEAASGAAFASTCPAEPFGAEVGTVLALEAQRYLAAVEVFRSEGCEPYWRPEPQVAYDDENVSLTAPLEAKKDE